MKKTLLALSLGLTLSAPLFAAATTAAPRQGANAATEAQIDDIEWSLKHSSVAQSLAASERDRSLRLIERARIELAAGHGRTALELGRRAAAPLAAMSESAKLGKHPDASDHIAEIRSTLASILDIAEEIAHEKSYPTGFVSEGREALRRADELAKVGRHAEGGRIVMAAYGRVQHEIAQLRSGDEFILAVPRGFSANEWSDGMRRYDERLNLSRFLIIEALAEGIDPAPLYNGMVAAENSLSEATRLASERRWEQAYQSLNLSYLKLEESWQAVGVEW